MLDPSGYELPPIPAKRYFTIGEVAKLCELKPHVLRYWEQEFPPLQLVKRRGNRRYYQRFEVQMIRQIKHLLYVEGFTVSGACARLTALLQEQEPGRTSATQAAPAAPTAKAQQATARMLQQLIAELEEVQDILRS